MLFSVDEAEFRFGISKPSNLNINTIWHRYFSLLVNKWRGGFECSRAGTMLKKYCFDLLYI